MADYFQDKSSDIVNSVARSVSDALRVGKLGGVKKEDAYNAVRDAASQTAEGLKGVNAQMLNALRAGNMDEVAKLTSQLDEVSLSKNKAENDARAKTRKLEEAEGEIERLKQDVEKVTGQKDEYAKKVAAQETLIKKAESELHLAKMELENAEADKKFEKTLVNGNTKVRLVDKAGTSVQYEKTPEGKFVYNTVIKLDGTKINTTYYPETGVVKNIRTTDPEGSVSVKYFDPEGKEIETPVAKPTLVKKGKVEFLNSGKTKTVDEYSDGSKRTVVKNELDEVISYAVTKGRTVLEKREFDPESGKEVIETPNRKRIKENGYVMDIKLNVDENCRAVSATRTSKFPKTSEFINKSVTDFRIGNWTYLEAVKETLYLKDGTQVVLSDFSKSDYSYQDPQKAVIVFKDGKPTREIIEKPMEWLTEIKHPHALVKQESRRAVSDYYHAPQKHDFII